MSSFARSIYYSHPAVRLANAMHQRRITVRHLVFATAAFVSLWVLYSFYSSRSYLSLPDSIYAGSNTSQKVWDARAAQVRRAFQHSYHGYEKYAWVNDAVPYDELKPLSNWKDNPFNAWGVTLFDSLDTMLMMGLQDEFKRALPRVQKATFNLPLVQYAPLFETVIRYLGGLLSAYALSHEPILLTRADDLGRMLAPAFDTPSGLPYFAVNPVSGQTQGPDIGILAEIASCQLEYTYLAKETGKKEYYDLADKVIKSLANADMKHLNGLAPIRWNITSGQPFDTHISVGAQADSTFEYFLKQHLLTAQSDHDSLRLYIDSINAVLVDLLYISPTRHLLYVTDKTGTPPSQIPSHVFEHLSCFLPGLLALGAHTLPLDTFTIPPSTRKGHSVLAGMNARDLHMWAAEGLAQTCWLSYADQPSGLGPDVMMFYAQGSVPWVSALAKWKGSGSRGPPPGMGDKQPVIYDQMERTKGARRGHSRDYTLVRTGYLLRPETLESIYYMWRTTGDARWRDRGWAIFEAIERETKTASGYASIRSVEVSPAPKEDSMPSYFLAETLKYLYLMFIEDDPISLNKYVFNTEAHPFPIFSWTDQEKETFGIP
ncbi:glycoside hydrolase family 47 protein [Plicaturopsis crispa FD-325 SS-3]|nr:glycoside hydrolase family 47 protein [Plicaturopsis crispa FD-325 SS-3]